jgi:peptide/nickel transport system permease protein
MLRKPNRRVQNALRELRSNKSAIFSAIFLILIILFSIFAFLSPYNPDAVDVMKMLQKPSLAHPFGTDELGRDYFTRALFGGKISLVVGLLAMLISTLIGAAVGTVSGYFGGVIDNVLMRIVDVLSSIPWMILVTVVSVFLTPGLKAIILVIGLFTWMGTSRLIRAETLSIKEREYVLYSVATGQSSFRIIVKHIIPSAFPTMIVAATTSIANAIMMESALSFLGLGVQQPMSSWGSMLQNAQSHIGDAPYMSILPGLLIVITVYSFNKIGDVLRVFVEPKESAI